MNSTRPAFTAPAAPPVAPPLAPPTVPTWGTTTLRDRLLHGAALVGGVTLLGAGGYAVQAGLRGGWLGGWGLLCGLPVLVALALATGAVALTLVHDGLSVWERWQAHRLYLTHLDEAHRHGLAVGQAWSHRWNGDPPPEPPEPEAVINGGYPARARPPAPSPAVWPGLLPGRPTTPLLDSYPDAERVLVQLCLETGTCPDRAAEARGLTRDGWKAAKDSLLAAGVLVPANRGRSWALASDYYYPSDPAFVHARVAARLGPPAGALRP